MKKLILILAFGLVSMSLFSQNTIRVRSETVGFWTVSADTMNILKADKVIALSIYVPTTETDSVTVTGCTFTIDGIASNGIKVPPGVTVNLGFKFAVLDSVNIMVPGSALVTQLIDRD